MKLDIHILMIGMLFFLIVLCFVGLLVRPGDAEIRHYLDMLVVAFLTKFTNGFGRFNRRGDEKEKEGEDAESTETSVRMGQRTRQPYTGS